MLPVRLYVWFEVDYLTKFLKTTWIFQKNLLLFIFGILGIGIGFITIIWMGYNLLSGEMKPEFRIYFGDNVLFGAIKIVGGLVINLSIIMVGKQWLVRSGVFQAIKIKK